MHSVIGNPVEEAQLPRLHTQTAVGLLCGLVFVFVYPFYLIISGIDSSALAKLQTENKTIYYLQDVIPILCFGVALACRRPHFFLRVPPALLLYCALGFLSAAWSDDPHISLKFSLRLLLYVFAVAALCEVLSLETLCRALMMMSAFIIVSSVGMAVLAPGYGIHQAGDALQSVHAGLWRGVFAHKNALGAMASYSTIAFLCFGRLGPRLPGLRPIGIGASLACLIFAGSVAAMASLAVVLIVYLVIFLTRRWPVSLTWLLASSAVAATVAVALLTEIDTSSLLGRDTTLTGRTLIWSSVLGMVADSPLLGHGYYAGTTSFAGPRLAELLGPAVSDAHGGYLSILLETGLAGLMLYLYSVLSVILMGTAQAKREGRVRRNCFMLLLLAPVLSLVFALVEAHPVSEEGCIGALNFFSVVAIYSYLKQSANGWLEAAHETSRDTGAGLAEH